MDLNWWFNFCYDCVCYLIGLLLYWPINIVLAAFTGFHFLKSKVYDRRELTDAQDWKLNFVFRMKKNRDDKATAKETYEEKSQDDNSGWFQTVPTKLKTGVAKLQSSMTERVAKLQSSVKESKFGVAYSLVKEKVKKTGQLNGDLHSRPHVGLLNQGSTCYLNALLQCLYFTPEFKEKLITNTNQQNLTNLAVDDIFKKLDEKLEAASTRELTKRLGLNPHKQQDVPEIFQRLLNEMDVDIPGGLYFKEVFSSTMVNLMECCNCPAKDGFQTATNIAVLPLAIMPRKDEKTIWSVADALEQFQAINKMTEENQIYCSKCKKKTDTTLRQTFTRLPPVLVVQLKRFEYRFRYDSFAKLHDKVLIDTNLDIHYEAEKPLEKKEIKSYELFAICDHCGEFWSGHYTAIIKPEGSKEWYHFNDSSVNTVKVETSQNTFSYGTYDLSSSRTAYLLMYREKSGSDQNIKHVSQGPVDERVLTDKTKKFMGLSTVDDDEEKHLDHSADPQQNSVNVPSMNSDLPHEIKTEHHNDVACIQANVAETDMQVHHSGIHVDLLPNTQTYQNFDQKVLPETSVDGNGQIETMSTSTKPEPSVVYEQASDAQTHQEEYSVGGSLNTHKTQHMLAPEAPKTDDDGTEQMYNNQTVQEEASAREAPNTHRTVTMSATTAETSAISEQIFPKDDSAPIDLNTHETVPMCTSITPETSEIPKQVSDNPTPQEEGSAGGADNSLETETVSTSITTETSDIPKQVSDNLTPQEEGSAGGAHNSCETETVSTSKTPERSDITVQVSHNQTPQVEGSAGGAFNTHGRETMSTSTPEICHITEQVSDNQKPQEVDSAGGAFNTHGRETMSTSTRNTSDFTEHVSDNQAHEEEYSRAGGDLV